MKRLFEKALLFCLAAACAWPLLAQDADLTSAQVGTCNLSGSVKVTVLGVVTTTTLPCINPTGVNSPGLDHDEIAGTATLGLTGLGTLATAGAPEADSIFANPAIGTTSLLGYEDVDSLSLMQGLIATGEMVGGIDCESVAGNLTCAAATALASLTVGGQSVVLPAAPIPLNYTIPLANLSLAVTVAGVGVVNVPVSGQIVLNKVTFGGTSTHVLVQHRILEARLFGSTSILGLGVIGVDATVTDSVDVLVSGDKPISLAAHLILVHTLCVNRNSAAGTFDGASLVCPN